MDSFSALSRRIFVVTKGLVAIRAHYASILLHNFAFPMPALSLLPLSIMSRPPRRIRKYVMQLRRNRLLTFQLLVVTLIFPILVWLGTSSLTDHTTVGMPAQLLQAQNVLVVTAHPDDESLFFGPTILHLTKRNIRTSLLVLSAGKHSPCAYRK